MTRPQAGIRIPLYVLLIGIAVVFISPILSIVAAVQISERNQAAVLEETRLQNCDLFDRLLDTYEETPPTTRAGQAVQETYRYYYNEIIHCTPRRTK